MTTGNEPVLKGAAYAGGRRPFHAISPQTDETRARENPSCRATSSVLNRSGKRRVHCIEAVIFSVGPLRRFVDIIVYLHDGANIIALGWRVKGPSYVFDGRGACGSFHSGGTRFPRTSFSPSDQNLQKTMASPFSGINSRDFSMPASSASRRKARRETLQ
jgi:hypothetical protein